ncbi:MAG TPA: glycosyltransferase family 4 protein [Tepidisphaeraceae bacterium]|nr:glycosyltransferase family 4 protein [Tepidisphaeraceae bacterium]
MGGSCGLIVLANCVDSADVSESAPPMVEENAPPAGVRQHGTPPRKKRDRLLIFSQVFVPDPASVGQHVADVAIEMARRGFKVRVYTANRGYDDPTRKYPAREILHGVEVIRLPLSSFGKKTILTRVIGTASFMVQAFVRGLLLPNVAGVMVSTSPPLIGAVSTVLRMFRGMPMAYWAMDLNPDQLLAMNKIKPGGFVARFLEAVNRTILNNSALVIALDRFMADRLLPRARVSKTMAIIPPWPHEDVIEPLEHDQNDFRKKHGLDGKFVVMYSGNHSPSNPLTTVLDAAVRLKDDDTVKFLFVGGGNGKKEVEQYLKTHALPHVISLPYQPLETLRYSLSAADVHVVSMGDNMVGIIHPCKVYGAMAVGRPVLYVGPRPSHIADLLDQEDFGRAVRHGDVDGCVAAIKSLQEMTTDQWRAMGVRGQTLLAGRLSQEILCGRFCDGLELTFEKRM